MSQPHFPDDFDEEIAKIKGLKYKNSRISGILFSTYKKGENSMKRVVEIEEALKNSEGVMLTTMDQSGFPTNQLFLKPVYRNHYYSMSFVIEEEEKLINALKKNSKAALCFFTTKTFDMVFLKGIVTKQEEIKRVEMQEYLTQYPRLKKLVKPMCLDFQTFSVEQGRIEPLC